MIRMKKHASSIGPRPLPHAIFLHYPPYKYKDSLMNILVVGSGGREHAIALAVKKSPLCDNLVCAPGNPGMANLGKCVPVDVADPKAIAALAVAEKIDLAIIGPEIPLVAGVVDEFRARGLRAGGGSAR